MKTRAKSPVFRSSQNSFSLGRPVVRGIAMDPLRLTGPNAGLASQALTPARLLIPWSNRAVMAHCEKPGEVCLGHRDRHRILIELNVANPARIDQQPPSKMDFALRNDLIIPHHCSNRLPVIALLVRAVRGRKFHARSERWKDHFTIPAVLSAANPAESACARRPARGSDRPFGIIPGVRATADLGIRRRSPRGNVGIGRRA